jgi:vancomycin permeability regulator SanA
MCTNVDIYVFIRLSLTNVFSLSIYKLEHHNDGIVLAYGAYRYIAFVCANTMFQKRISAASELLPWQYI